MPEVFPFDMYRDIQDSARRVLDSQLAVKVTHEFFIAVRHDLQRCVPRDGEGNLRNKAADSIGTAGTNHCTSTNWPGLRTCWR